MPPNSPYGELPAFDPESGDLNAVIDTTKGSRNKDKYDEELGLFDLSGVLPAGAAFPFDFGYVRGTEGRFLPYPVEFGGRRAHGQDEPEERAATTLTESRAGRGAIRRTQRGRPSMAPPSSESGQGSVNARWTRCRRRRPRVMCSTAASTPPSGSPYMRASSIL